MNKKTLRLTVQKHIKKSPFQTTLNAFDRMFARLRKQRHTFFTLEQTLPPAPNSNRRPCAVITGNCIGQRAVCRQASEHVNFHCSSVLLFNWSNRTNLVSGYGNSAPSPTVKRTICDATPVTLLQCHDVASAGCVAIGAARHRCGAKESAVHRTIAGRRLTNPGADNSIAIVPSWTTTVPSLCIPVPPVGRVFRSNWPVISLKCSWNSPESQQRRSWTAVRAFYDITFVRRPLAIVRLVTLFLVARSCHYLLTLPTDRTSTWFIDDPRRKSLGPAVIGAYNDINQELQLITFCTHRDGDFSFR